MMLRCKECKAIFDEDETIRVAEDCTPYGGWGEPSFINYWESCPCCGGGALEEYDEDEEEYEEEGEEE